MYDNDDDPERDVHLYEQQATFDGCAIVAGIMLFWVLVLFPLLGGHL